jgi:signal transduction histidine kinase
MTHQPASSFSPRSPRFWLAAFLVGLTAWRSWQQRVAPVAAPTRDLGQEAFAAQSRLNRALAQEQARITRRAEVVQEELAHLVKERLPAALAMTEIPPSLHGADRGDDGLDAGVAESFDQLLAEISQTVADREESRRLALIELASRVQTSAHRIQAAVTGLAARHPGDPDLLETTMRVDHAATQQARHAQSLKVLSGEWPGQQWQKPLALVDVVRAASGRIVAFNRVEVTGDLDVAVTPAVVEPMIHLLAELLANATEYSPPKTGVPVTVRTVQRGAVVEVEDGGIGMDEYRLAEAREIVSGRRLLGVGDVGEIPQTGFAVVGRFAHRHGFDVDLGPSPYGGIRAVVLVPSNVLETLAPAGTEPLTGSHPLAEAPPLVTPEPVTPVTPVTPETKPAPVVEVTSPATASTAKSAAKKTGKSLPQRHSRRDSYAPVVAEEPAAVVPPVTPEAAGDWMEQFFEGGQPEPTQAEPTQAEPTQAEPTLRTAESPEGQS